MILLRRPFVVFSRLSVLIVTILAFSPLPASAVPSFARQTGLPCNTCHTNFPELTAFGRQFKLNGYVMSSGEKWVPPLAGMAQLAFTHTGKGQPGGAAPGFSDNDNVAINQISLFYGGAVIPGVMGAFIQGTYDGAGKDVALDNTDIRAAKTAIVGGKPLVVGVTFNNNPTVSDLWNTTPAWGFPYTDSGLAPGPDAGTMIQGAFAQQVGGIGLYSMFDNLLYVEVDGYDTLSSGVQKFFGEDWMDEAQIHNLAPYWRVALQHTWGSHFLEVGHLRHGRLGVSGPGPEHGRRSRHRYRPRQRIPVFRRQERRFAPAILDFGAAASARERRARQCRQCARQAAQLQRHRDLYARQDLRA